MASWHSEPGTYGGGGMAGGEPVNNTFIEPSNGGRGEAYMISVKTSPVDCSNKFLVNVNGVNHKVINLKNKNTMLDSPAWHNLRRSLSIPYSRSNYNRKYQTSPFKIDTTTHYENVELVNIDEFNQDIGLIESKIVNSNSPVKVLYSKSNNESNCVDIEIENQWFNTIGAFTGTIGSPNRTDYIYVMLQAGGGGGGGADNTWSLFNYAIGGGGGAGGGAVCFRIKVDKVVYNYELTVGKGGTKGKNSGSGTAGENGGDSSLIIKDTNNNIVAQVTVSGGTGGGGGVGNSGGKGGTHGRLTVFNDNAGILTQICIVDGGDGGNAANAGKAIAGSSGIWQDTISTGLFDIKFTADQVFGTPGPLVGADDKGGSGGASWLGDGGYYSDEDMVVGT